MSERAAGGLSGYLSGIIAGIWVALAWQNPENTYYIAPFLVAASFPIAQRVKVGRLNRRDALWSAGGGMINVLVATGLLFTTGKLDGTSLLSFWGPAPEAVFLGLVGALLGGAIAQARVPATLARR